MDVSEEKCHGKCLKEHFIPSRFSKFSEGGWGVGVARPQTLLAARAFGDRDLPRLALKSGYGPGAYIVVNLRKSFYHKAEIGKCSACGGADFVKNSGKGL